jgi:hypothetical protein
MQYMQYMQYLQYMQYMRYWNEQCYLRPCSVACC